MNRRTIQGLLVGTVLVLSGCDALFQDPDHEYGGPAQVEFAPVLPSGAYTRTVTFQAGNNAVQRTTVRVNYIAPPPRSAVMGGIRLSEGSAAGHGTHFRMPEGWQYTIAPGTNSVDVPVELLGSGLSNGGSITLVLELAPGEGFQVAERYKRFTITVRKNAQ